MAERPAKGSRKGYTTGACSAAAARAAVLGLLTGQVPERVDCLLPNGQTVTFNVLDGWADDRQAGAVVEKDAGDDPDCTHGAHLTAEVSWLEAPGQVELLGGVGVGLITRPGLGLAVGGPAINPVPRRNIEDNIRRVATDALQHRGVQVTISVPGGEAMAKKTLNYRLGIVGGISILGTTGIVHPYSTAAFRASVVQGVEVAANQGQHSVVLTTGGRTEKFVMRELPQLDESCFVQMGDFLTPALDAANRCGIARIIIGGMVGKLTKMAQGETITHAGRAPVDVELVADIARHIGAPPEVCAAIAAQETARYASECMAELGLEHDFHVELANRVIATLERRYPGRFSIRVLVCDFDGNKLAEAGGIHDHG
ncbi:MAG: cobalt-precorrin-5B (C(1))-methyltransferase [Methylomonas sp.]|nr:cobalt-precorrin-5B (C(1))-methyltransferase [Methylomonas sp.]PPD21364.1 MAG: cobalt-precorrin-5B (C(1))-methyltransferase [Methylomonas sp.]PPD26941.1 MAG: cobalt-precorrin-5B (C(1))-methyltransferase [Methylomonas sp.]PPD38873.1 MAG: cobalt-precorrin-5B (C(1))-methyltransferase [Methylomonas sp.]PPD41744.1 MAG: cobalt-precorrin-5B (C(1))-methyltransferase [Methylomonas sp.]